MLFAISRKRCSFAPSTPTWTLNALPASDDGSDSPPPADVMNRSSPTNAGQVTEGVGSVISATTLPSGDTLTTLPLP